MGQWGRMGETGKRVRVCVWEGLAHAPKRICGVDLPAPKVDSDRSRRTRPLLMGGPTGVGGGGWVGGSVASGWVG